MFTEEERARLRRELIERAQRDGRISAGAITGSAAAGKEDIWSDIDLAFAVRDGEEFCEVLEDWTERMYAKHMAVHHTDVLFGTWTYRVFLLQNTLQVDLAFAPAKEFGALSSTFRLLFGQVGQPSAATVSDSGDFIGMGWLHALHARSSIGRRKLWQGEYMVSGVRDNALALACLRHGVPTVHGRGIDMLPAEVAASFEPSLVGELNTNELTRAFRAVLRTFLNEIRYADSKLADRLHPVLTSLAGEFEER